jgi:hypothetical protein
MSGRGIEAQGGDADPSVMGRRHPFALTLIVVAFIAPGCGGDDASYATDADAICAQVVADSRALYRTSGAARAARDRAFSRIVRGRGAALAELHRLTPPPEQRARVERMLSHFDKSQRLLRQGERSWGKSEQAPFLIIFASREGDKGHEIARELGLDDCAEF